MSEFFPVPKASGETVKVDWDLSNYATKTDRFKKCSRCWYIKVAKKIDLANLKSEVD